MKNKHHSNTLKKIKKLNCSPLLKRHKQTHKLHRHSCYSNRGLFKLIKYWNSRHPDNKFTSNDPYEIWTFFKNNFNNVCNNEKCWLKQKFIQYNNKDLLKYFSPKAPDSWKIKPNTWLNSVDLANVMNQYETAYPNFNFIGPSPIDFDKKLLYDNCVWEELCKFSLNEHIKKNINKIGIIFNTDPHYKSGSHWIALFIDVKNSFIFYFDSNGNSIPRQIKKLVNKVQTQAKHNNIDLKYYDNNNFIHQKGDGQCGIYVLYFIIELLLEKKTPEFFKKHRITDDEMKNYRLIYYN
tara:strand:+ start:5203 stop:6084 length:882 start_codon:yes stop_codon:yes gene_type:complete